MRYGRVTQLRRPALTFGPVLIELRLRTSASALATRGRSREALQPEFLTSLIGIHRPSASQPSESNPTPVPPLGWIRSRVARFFASNPPSTLPPAGLSIRSWLINRRRRPALSVAPLARSRRDFRSGRTHRGALGIASTRAPFRRFPWSARR